MGDAEFSCERCYRVQDAAAAWQYYVGGPGLEEVREVEGGVHDYWGSGPFRVWES